MPIEKIARILKAHSVPYFIKNNRIYADTMDAAKAELEEVVDLTDYSLRDLRDWLGY